MLDTHFSNIKEVLSSRIDGAESSIHLSIKLLSDQDLFELLCEKASKGIMISIIFESIATSFDLNYIKKVGGKSFNIQPDNGSSNFCIIDKNLVLTGFSNWSFSDPNVGWNLIEVKNEPQLVEQFLVEFQKVVNNPSGFSYKNLPIILKRLTLIKQLIELEEIDEVASHIKKLRQYQLPSEVVEIIAHIEQGNYGNGVSGIILFNAQKTQLANFKDPEVQALGLEIKVLELKLASANSEKLEVQKLIQDFSIQHNRALGELVQEILELRKVLSGHEAEKLNNESAQKKYQEAKQDYEEYNKGFEELRKKKYKQLTQEEAIQLKKIYRRASMLCHPDRNIGESPEIQRKLEEIFKELNQANDENDIERVKEILDMLENGDFSKITINSSEKSKEELRSKIQYLKEKLKQVLEEIVDLKSSKVYQNISELGNWKEYFEERKNILTEQLQFLQKKLNSYER